MDTWYERLAAWWLGQRFRQAFWESFREHAVPTAVQVVPNDLYGSTLRGRILMSAFGPGQVLQFTLDNATRSTAVGIGPLVEGLPNIVDLQFGADGHLYVLTIRTLYRVDAVSGQ